jgi:peptide-methionine (S)-S-oxide reductase
VAGCDAGGGRPGTVTEEATGGARNATATFGAGCFWCVEAVFRELNGVVSVEPGYTGGSVPNPTYEAVCTGTTGHAEAVQVRYNPGKISYRELLEVFWNIHDPTTPNRQGADVGSQYRSVIFYHDGEQRRQAEEYRKKLDSSGSYPAPVVTEIVPFKVFYPAEERHRDYFRRNPGKTYCALVIAPKMAKFREVFADRLAK